MLSLLTGESFIVSADSYKATTQWAAFPTFTLNGRMVQKPCTTVIPVFWRLRQKNNEFKTLLNYIGDPVSNPHFSKKMLKRKMM